MLGRPVRTDFQVFVQSGRVPVFSSSEGGFYEELRVIMYYVVIFHNYILFFLLFSFSYSVFCFFCIILFLLFYCFNIATWEKWMKDSGRRG